PAGKIRCYITGELRKDTPEEHVRQRIARSLVEEYGYPKEDIELNFVVQVGRAKKRVDIAVFGHGRPHTQENIFLIGETKREEIKPSDRDNGIAQLKSYLAACFNAKWGLWVGSELQAYEVTVEAGERKPVEVAGIPPYGKTQPPRITFQQLLPAEGLRDVFKRCHNYIYANQGKPKEQAFHDLLKLIFCKVHDEQHTEGEMRFDVSNEERRSALGQRRLRQRIDELFGEVKDRYPYIFATHDRIELDDRVLAYIVSELCRYSLLQTSTDVKGEAYQEIVRENLRGARGEFFTPPNVCQMAVEMVLATYQKDKWLSLKVLDPACGTGGFLRATMNLWREHIIAHEKRKWKLEHEARAKAAERLKELCDRNLFGIDINPELVRAAQMNLVMHGDGSTNVFQANSLLPPGEWRDDVQKSVRLNSFDVVFTNPPFGAGPGLAVDDQHILAQYDLRYRPVEVRKEKFRGGRPPDPTERQGVPPEQLFIERCWQFLKPGGRMAIVLPDSILSNPGLLFIRRWILKHCRVIASVDLPVETFLAFSGTGTQTSVLLLDRKSQEEIRLEEASGRQQDYEVFMSLCETMGYDRRGNDLWQRTPEGEIIEHEAVTSIITIKPGSTVYEPRREMKPLRDDDVAQVAPLFNEWWSTKVGRKPGA
ncbi:MAG: N-6 DNA methylase, partial [Planctomycetes bacterium]|nr:N-6 DNA methylase [Planctomycetota bacterium]